MAESILINKRRGYLYDEKNVQGKLHIVKGGKNMRKILALLALFCLVFALGAYAENDAASADGQNKTVKGLNKEYAKEIVKNKIEAIKNVVKTYNEAKENYQEKMKEYKEKLKEQKEGLKELHQEAKIQRRTIVKDAAMAHAKLLTSYLEQIKEKAQLPENKEKLDALISQIEAKKIAMADKNVADINVLELVSDVKELKELTLKTKLVARIAALRANVAKLTVWLNKAQISYNRAEKLIAKLEETGKDMAKEKLALADYKARVDSAKAKLELLKNKTLEISNKEDVTKEEVIQAYNDAHDMVKQMHVDLKEAFNILKNAIHEYLKSQAQAINNTSDINTSTDIQ